MKKLIIIALLLASVAAHAGYYIVVNGKTLYCETWNGVTYCN